MSVGIIIPNIWKNMFQTTNQVYIILWVCMKIVYLIFQWIITMFPIKISICGHPLFSDKPVCTYTYLPER